MGEMPIGPLKGKMERKAVYNREDFKKALLALFTQFPNERMEDMRGRLDAAIRREVEEQRRSETVPGSDMRAVLDEMASLHPGYKEVLDQWKGQVNW